MCGTAWSCCEIRPKWSKSSPRLEYSGDEHHQHTNADDSNVHRRGADAVHVLVGLCVNKYYYYLTGIHPCVRQEGVLVWVDRQTAANSRKGERTRAARRKNEWRAVAVATIRNFELMRAPLFYLFTWPLIRAVCLSGSGQDPSPVLQERHADPSTITSDTDTKHWHIVAQDRAAWKTTMPRPQ